MKPLDLIENAISTLETPHRGARYLMGENLEVVWAEFSSLSQAV
jgi:hypothetical protein